MISGVVSTDGSCISSQNQGHGPIGWAWVLHNDDIIVSGSKADIDYYKNQFIHNSGGTNDGTNQIAELTAVVEALRTFAPHSKKPIKDLTIESDSKYAIESFSTWLENWKRNGWKNSKKQIISNYELITFGSQLIDQRVEAGGSVKFKWIKGHSGNFYNEFVDSLALQKANEYK